MVEVAGSQTGEVEADALVVETLEIEVFEVVVDSAVDGVLVVLVSPAFVTITEVLELEALGRFVELEVVLHSIVVDMAEAGVDKKWHINASTS